MTISSKIKSIPAFSATVILALLLISPVSLFATQPANRQMKSQWGGYARLQGSVAWPDDQSIFSPVGTGPYYDHQGEFRFKDKLFFSKWGYLEAHYEVLLSGGDTRRRSKKLERLYPNLFPNGIVRDSPASDERRLMDLTDNIHKSDSSVVTHRLDRLSVTLQPEWSTIRIGRQALTWGNGLMFNPMDLFNPFSPTDILRYYKVGDDMATVQVPLSQVGDFQFLYVSRRDPVTHDVEWDQSSLAGKLHFAAGTNEFDLMCAEHYDDNVLGFGAVGYIGDAAWRFNATYTFLKDDAGRDSFPALVANLDYSWAWWDKNFYGALEFYFNGLGDNDYTQGITNPKIAERLNRGEMFTIGRTYLGGMVQAELHPLFTVKINVINNMADPSGILQPRAIWDITQDLQLVFGANVYYGGRGTEYGGFKLARTDLLNKPANSVFVWLSYFY